ncbi:MAG TPA: hypothetical protein VJO52_11960 [Gemmatimonadaceae bacterium]|nr:hypothetical protein [Gemmatimonadaceae bacterium]
MRLIVSCVAMMLGASSATAQTVVPGSPLLRPGRIHPYTDSISLVLIPKDSAQRVAGTLVRRVEEARDGGVAVFRETQEYTLAAGGTEVDTLDVVAATLEPMRIVQINATSGQDLRFHDGRLTGTAWSADSGRKTIDIPLGAPFFHRLMTESFIAAFPLAPDSTLRLPVSKTPDVAVRMAAYRVTGTTTLRTAAGAVECLVVQESPTTVAWVSKADGRLVRLHRMLPNGTAIWKLPTRDVPFLDVQDAVTASRDSTVESSPTRNSR